MVATADVARIAADVLLDESWQGRQSMDVLGPQDLSLAQAVQILSEELGEQISYEQLEGSLCLEHMTNIGLGADMARLLVRSYEWIEGGTPDYAARRDPAQSWQQDFRSFVRQTFVPIFSALH